MTLIPLSGADLNAHALRAVRALAEHGSITAAAAALDYSQPAISQVLKRLEQRLGMPVVERVGRGVRLTEAGAVLARHALTVTTALEAAAAEIAELQGLRAGRVRLAAFPSASATLVPRLLALLDAAHPDVTVTYLEAEPPEAIAGVRENRVDLALTFSYPGDSGDPTPGGTQGLTRIELCRDEMLLVLPVGHVQAGRAEIDLAALSTDAWIGGCPQCRGHLLELCSQSGFTPHIAYETDNVAAVLGLVAEGIGVAMLPAMALRTSGGDARVAIRQAAGHPQRTVHAVTAGGAERMPAVAVAVARLVELAQAGA